MNLKLKTEKTTKTVTERYEPWEGASVELVKTVVNRGKPKWSLSGKGPLGAYPQMMKADWRETLKKINPFVQYEKSPVLDNFAELDELIKSNSDDLKDRMVWWYSGGHMIFDMDGNPVPFPHRFDYIGTIFSNKYLNLSKAIEHLKKHPWIINADELRIEEVPYYNRDADCYQFFSPVILPDAKEYSRLFELAKKRDPEFPTVRLKEMIASWIYSEEDPLDLWQFLTKEGQDFLEKVKEYRKPKVKLSKKKSYK